MRLNTLKASDVDAKNKVDEAKKLNEELEKLKRGGAMGMRAPIMTIQ